MQTLLKQQPSTAVRNKKIAGKSQGQMMLFCVVLLFLGLVGASTPAKPASEPPLLKAVKPASNLPYCPVDAKLAEALKTLSRRQKRKKGASSAKRRQRRATVSWPFDCIHASLTYNQGQLAVDFATYDCCENTCQFPNFVQCVASGTSDVATRCPNEALQCIESCIKTHLFDCGQQLARVQSGRVTASQKKISRPTGTRERCPTRKKKVNGSYCLERSCIPVQI